MIELNANDEDDLTTTLATELAHKHRLAEVTYAARAERVTISDSETETEEENKNHTGTASFRDLYLPKKK